MDIRANNKDHLKRLAEPLAETPKPANESDYASTDPLRFWTKHKSRTLVDLHFLKNGEFERTNKGGTWNGPFSGRAVLIEQLAPVLENLYEYSAPKTVTHLLHSLRGWWRIFDRVEAVGVGGNGSLARVVTVKDIGELHRQHAFDVGMAGLPFSIFIRALNVVRIAENLPQLYWQAPERVTANRHLPPKWQTDEIRFALKRGWFAALDRWERAERLVQGDVPVHAEEARLQKNYNLFRDVLSAQKGARLLAGDDLRGQMPPWMFAERGYNVTEMFAGFFPDATDIRMAFHLCLATTGWNPSVLLSLDINDPFIEPHPKDPSRYLMWGYKARGDSEQVTEGLFKSQGSAGVVIQELMRRTAPLRAALREELAAEEKRLARLKGDNASQSDLDKARKQALKLKAGLKSPWLYVTAQGVSWLTERSFGRGLIGDRTDQFLDNVVDNLNRKRPADRQLTGLKPSDLRDAFAAFAYQISGGMVLYVMKALGHKRLANTQRYLDNTLINDKSNKLFHTFSQGLWHEIKLHRRVDPTIIAKWSRDGAVTGEERERLDAYRSLRRSRIGVGCKDPTKPPQRIAPTFKADGRSMCHIHRCTLCPENAVIFPDSLIGLCKRLAELYVIQSNMSALAFIESSFGEEIANTEGALMMFDASAVSDQLAEWKRRIETGKHRIVDLDGLQITYS